MFEVEYQFFAYYLPHEDHMKTWTRKYRYRWIAKLIALRDNYSSIRQVGFFTARFKETSHDEPAHPDQ